MGILYIVATPIGNLKDITQRASKILTSVDCIASEDTRKTGMLLKDIYDRYADWPDFYDKDKKPKLISYYEQNEFKRIPEIIDLLSYDKNIALVSDAGTPTISDPGFKLVRECIKKGIRVESIPGPSSVISSLVSSGLPTDKFLFLGYLPKKQGHRLTLLKNLSESLKLIESTVIFFEAPHKLIKTLEELKDVFGDINIVICRELTKIYEEVRREKVSETLQHFRKIVPKGELVILFNLKLLKG